MNIENYKIRQFRKELKLRQEDLAKEINVSTQLIRMYENGTRNPSSEKKKEICRLFSISLNELEGGKDKEQLKFELQEQINTFNLTINKYQVLKISLLKNFTEIVTDELDIQSLLENTHKNTYLKQLEQYILNFILKHYICESIFTSTCYNEDILKHNYKEINNLLTNFIKSNIRFLESAIEELYYKEDNLKQQIPIINSIISDWNDLVSNAKEYTSKLRRIDKKIFGYKINDNEMCAKYEIGNIAILEWTTNFNDNDDILFCIDDSIKLRRIKKTEKGIILQPLNPLVEIDFYTNEDLKDKNIKIIGKVIEIKINN